jgi:hypothetical protein
MLGDISTTGSNTFAIQATYGYADTGMHTYSVTVKDSVGNNVFVTGTIDTQDPPLLGGGDPGQTSSGGGTLTLGGSGGGTLNLGGSGGNVTAPTLTLNGADQIDEGFVYKVLLSATTSDNNTIDHWTINWGDGSAPQKVAGNPPAIGHVYAYAAPGTFTISATATDNNGTWDAGNTQTVMVQNLAPTVDVSITYGSQRMVTLSGHVTDAAAANLLVTFTGMVNGTAWTDASGYFTLTAQATGLGQVLVSTTDAGGLDSNIAEVNVSREAPRIDQFSWTHLNGNFYNVTGHVTDDSAEGLTVVLSGILALANVEVAVQTDGTFSYTWELCDPDETGIITAQITDWWGLQSNVAQDLFNPQV